MPNKRIAAIVTCVDSWQVCEEAIENLHKSTTSDLTDIIALDNGSYTSIPDESNIVTFSNKIIRFDNNRGGNSVFHRILPLLSRDYDVLAFMHNDLMMIEKGWDQRILEEGFDRDPKLALIGLVGSNEIDMAGGRGLGTTLSYMGYEYRTGWASKAEIHGARTRGLQAGAVTDHCCMIFRKSMLEQLPAQDENDYHTPGHFYDRILCCEIVSRGWHIANMGLECDHFGGGIGMCKVPGEQVGITNKDDYYKVWLTAHNIPYTIENIETVMYQESERRYLSKWRDELHFIPFKVHNDYYVEHRHPQWGK